MVEYNDVKKEYIDMIIKAIDCLDDKKITGINIGRSIIRTPITTVTLNDQSRLDLYYDRIEEGMKKLDALKTEPTTFYVDTYDSFMDIPDGTKVRLHNGQRVTAPDKDNKNEWNFNFFLKSTYKGTEDV